MDVQIEVTTDMSEMEQQQYCDRLVWADAQVTDQWQAGCWCITLKTSALVLSFLLPKSAQPMSVAFEAR